MLGNISRGPRKHFPIKHIFKKTFTLYQNIKRVSKDTEALSTAIFLRRTLTLWRIKRAGRVLVITKLAHPQCSSSHNLKEACKGSLKKKISPAFANKACNRIKASTFTGRSYRVRQKVESSHKWTLLWQHAAFWCLHHKTAPPSRRLLPMHTWQ